MIKNTLSWVVLIIFFLIGGFGVQYYRDSQSQNAIQEEISQVMDSIIAEAKSLPGKSKSEAIREVSAERGAELILSSSSASDAQEQAASMFMGFYLVNKRTRYDYCFQYRVDISPFISELTELNNDVYKKAGQILSLLSSSDEDALYQVLAPEFEPLVNDLMQSAAAEYGLTPTELCELYKDEPKFLVADYNFMNLLPEAYETLMD